jgi:hypothetical protein
MFSFISIQLFDRSIFVQIFLGEAVVLVLSKGFLFLNLFIFLNLLTDLVDEVIDIIGNLNGVSVRTSWLHAPLVLVTSSSLSGSRIVHGAIFRLVLRIVPWRVRSMIGVLHGIIIYTQILIELW